MYIWAGILLRRGKLKVFCLNPSKSSSLLSSKKSLNCCQPIYPYSRPPCNTAVQDSVWDQFLFACFVLEEFCGGTGGYQAPVTEQIWHQASLTGKGCILDPDCVLCFWRTKSCCHFTDGKHSYVYKCLNNETIFATLPLYPATMDLKWSSHNAIEE